MLLSENCLIILFAQNNLTKRAEVHQHEGNKEYWIYTSQLNYV